MIQKGKSIIIISTIGLFCFWMGLIQEKENKIEEYLNNTTHSLSKSYKIFYEHQKSVADIIFQAYIDKAEIKEIMLEVKKTKNEAELKVYRERLLTTLQDTYRLLQKNNLKQLHFHLDDDRSFLRFHRPKKYGDMLKGIRPTITYVNSFQKRIDGFEEGRIFNGYRFVYPLVYKDEYLSSVEVSFATSAMSEKFLKKLGLASSFFIKKEIVYKKVFTDEQSNYISVGKEYFVEKKVLEKLKKIDIKLFENSFMSKPFEEYFEKKYSKEAFSIYDEVAKKVFTFLVVKNPLTHKIVGYFVIKTQTQYISNKKRNVLFIGSLVSSIIVIVIILLWRAIIYKEKLETANKELNSKNIYIHNLFEKAPIPIFYKDKEGVFLACNRAFEEMIGIKREELLNKRAEQIKDSRAKAYIHKDRELFANPHEPQVYETTIFNIETKKTLSVMFFKNIIFDEKGSVNGIIGTVLDITEQRDAQKALERLNNSLAKHIQAEVEKNRLKDQQIISQSRLAQMGEMLSMIAHQWRQPLAAINATTGNLNLKLILEEDIAKEYIQNEIDLITEYTNHLSETIDDFRNFFTTKKKRQKITLEKITEETLKIIKSSIEARSINLVKDFQCNKEILTYAHEIKQVLLNLLKNSQDAILENNVEHGEIVIRTECSDLKRCITIKDNGGGVSSEIIEKIFDPYFSTKKSRDGTGLGLYMSKTIVEKNCKGELQVYNSEDGAVFKITLPNNLEDGTDE